MTRAIDLTGMRFGRLAVIERAGSSGSGRARWFVKCDCGTEKVVAGREIRQGNTKSCGCWRREAAAEAHTKHGMAKCGEDRIYKILKNMISRCTDESNNHFHYYGGRGITVCLEWANDPTAFRDWALANGYRDDLTIDREDNDKGYSPDNCRWVDRFVQAQNTRRVNGTDGVRRSRDSWTARIQRNGSCYSKTFPSRKEAVAWRKRMAAETKHVLEVDCVD